MALVAMATDHGGRRAESTGDAGSPIGGRPSGPLMEDRRRACKGNSVPVEERVVGDASVGVSRGADSVVSDCCNMYYSQVLRPVALYSIALRTANPTVLLVRCWWMDLW